jgi:hypothetical protein
MRRGDVVVIADRGAGDFGGKPRPAAYIDVNDAMMRAAIELAA